MDIKLRELERRAITGDDEDKATYLHALVHAKQTTAKEIEALAWLKYPPALLLFPQPKKLKEPDMVDLYTVHEFCYSFAQRGRLIHNLSWKEFENQVIARLPRSIGVQLAVTIFERYIVPISKVITPCLTSGSNFGHSVENYVRLSKMYQETPKKSQVIKQQTEKLKKNITNQVWNCPAEYRAMATEVRSAMFLDDRSKPIRRILYFIIHAIARICDLDRSQSSMEIDRTQIKPDWAYKEEIMQTAEQLLLPPALRTQIYAWQPPPPRQPLP